MKKATRENTKDDGQMHTPIIRRSKGHGKHKENTNNMVDQRHGSAPSGHRQMNTRPQHTGSAPSGHRQPKSSMKRGKYHPEVPHISKSRKVPRYAL